MSIPAYYGAARGKMELNGVTYPGTFYKLTKMLTKQDKIDIKTNYRNIVPLVIKSQYAPEIVHSGLFIADSNIR